ncbi:hypothetical protein D8B26_003180 [Coccidioides posadasii str. Silveira]|uniref:Uncharacterized protein n=2 Tax=Coccidioides posadasii TaxID=199306 RepID=E9CYZ5_COCPS|nr:hypothetical protein CPC735_006130 [Coccidioides posadasii C735 delta SOWgp]EER26441.1 hypothetical protein CPC735_006130 [Coccidioides posadasii C735 delta SOWgp]EFW20439.1 conserved hypothetical protein [Coccidioides posadasii str. Silveira]QVM08491.1 hypothetical protein D8B26_003180 [Coccidioides posadasii str. Silveira]|eukprot:XP_003068586.1 hypothetical protein CPC735_006130 [Coccidioides posadasii C735 delta SOWgp]
MASCTVYLATCRNAPSQRKHFGIFVPFADDPQICTIIHVVGAPMVGYELQFKRNYNLSSSQLSYQLVPIGQVSAANIVESPSGLMTIDSNAKGIMETVATQVPPPPISQNFLAPVDGVFNKRCQEWTVEYVDRLISRNIIDAGARNVVQAHRDPPDHGVGLQSVDRGRGRGV